MSSGEPIITEHFTTAAPGTGPAVTLLPGSPVDGRNRRARLSRDAILNACKAFMEGGMLRPPMTALCNHAGRCTRTGFQAFHSIDELYREAIQDPVTVGAIAVRVLGDESPALSDEARERVVRAVVLGRVT